MTDLDEILEQKLEELESGAPLEKVLASLPETNEDLADMIRLAVLLQRLPQPEASPIQARARQFKLMTSAQTTSLARKGGKSTLRWIVTSGTFRIVTILFAVLLVAAAGVWLAGPSGARAATLMDVSGQVQVTSPGGATDWRAATNGERLRAGQSIRTLDASSATLVYFDGSRTTLGADSALSISTLNGRWGKVLQAQLDQQGGNTGNSVVPLRGGESFFRVDTPAGTASVHGTRFDVQVAQNGQTRFAVNSGVVLVQNADSQLSLAAGQATVAIPSKTIAAPSYQFNLQGELSAQDGNTWTVAGVSFLVGPQTMLNDDPQVGQNVAVLGRIQGNKGWIADNVELTSDISPLASFTGILVSNDGDVWQVGNDVVHVDGQTQVGAGLQTGDPVEVTFAVLGNLYWQALTVQPLNETTGPSVKVSQPAVPTESPQLQFAGGDILDDKACGSEVSLEGGLENASLKGTASNVELKYLVTAGADNVSQVDVSPFKWQKIDPGQTVNFTISVSLKPQWLESPENAQVVIQVILVKQGNSADGTLTALNVTLTRAGCTETETPTVPPVSGSEPTGRPITDCVGATPQPTAEMLAETYGVDYEEIMGWFCQGFGFGEIDLAYSLSQQNPDYSVEEIFALRSSGMGWGAIKEQVLPKQVGNDNAPQNNVEKPTKTPRPQPTRKPK